MAMTAYSKVIIAMWGVILLIVGVGFTKTYIDKKAKADAHRFTAIPVFTFATPPPEVKPPKWHPPLTLAVGAYQYHVKFTTKLYLDMNSCSAFTNSATHEIWLYRGEPLADMQESMLHELMHASLASHKGEYMANYLNDENTFVTPLAPELLETLKDNPELAKWLVRP